MDEVTPSPLTPTSDQLRTWGLDPTWSRRVTVTSSDGSDVEWHFLDTGAGTLSTIVCVHGNPSWSYLWRDLLTTLSPQWRVIAVDQTNMGYSERTSPRRLAQRVDELVDFCRREVSGPVVLVAHDWGGPVAIGASAHLEVQAIVLANTAVAKPEGMKVPPLIELARRVTDLSCRVTPLFVEGAARMTGRNHRAALRAPYRSASRRAGVAAFVADIPVVPSDPSFEALATSAAALGAASCPVLVLWGGRDPVFSDRFLDDLRRRVPRAAVHRFPRAGHYVPLDEAIGTVVRNWLDTATAPVRQPIVPAGEGPFESVVSTTARHRVDDAVVYQGPDGELTWAELARRSTTASEALTDAGLAKGDRVSVLMEPGADLLVATLAVWKCAAVPFVADASGGVAQLRRLVRAGAPRFVLGTRRSLALSVMLGVAPGARRAGFVSQPGVIDLRSSVSRSSTTECTLSASDVAVIVHTSGSTGPAKPVRYSHGAVAALRAALTSMGLSSERGFTTSFAPFMLLAPALEMRCVRPDFDVAKPSEMGFDQLSAAQSRAVGTAWLSPAAASTIVATANGRRAPLELVMLAGAPIAPSLARAIAEVTGADVRTPYGMTECLPVTDGRDFDVEGAHGGYSTGSPVEGCRVFIKALDAPGPLVDGPAWGEICVSAPWMLDGYEAQWSNDIESQLWIDEVRFHRTGDVGYLEHGRLFVLGRLAHVIWTVQGPMACVALESPVASRLGREVAVVGVGAVGAEVLCVVVQAEGALRVAGAATRTAVRDALGAVVAAVLEGTLPTDHRHESKVDRGTLRTEVTRLLGGR